MYTYEGKQIEATVEREVTQLYTFHSVLTTFKSLQNSANLSSTTNVLLS